MRHPPSDSSRPLDGSYLHRPQSSSRDGRMHPIPWLVMARVIGSPCRWLYRHVRPVSWYPCQRVRLQSAHSRPSQPRADGSVRDRSVFCSRTFLQKICLGSKRRGMAEGSKTADNDDHRRSQTVLVVPLALADAIGPSTWTNRTCRPAICPAMQSIAPSRRDGSLRIPAQRPHSFRIHDIKSPSSLAARKSLVKSNSSADATESRSTHLDLALPVSTRQTQPRHDIQPVQDLD